MTGCVLVANRLPVPEFGCVSQSNGERIIECSLTAMSTALGCRSWNDATTWFRLAPVRQRFALNPRSTPLEVLPAVRFVQCCQLLWMRHESCR